MWTPLRSEVERNGSISLARNVEKRHRFWGARALGSWQSIQIACRLQESVREDTGRRVLHVVRIELTARSHILVSWSVYPNYEYHYFTMYLVHLWLVEISCRLECISAAAKWSPGRQMQPIKRSGDPDIPNYRSDWRIEKFSCQSPCSNFWLSKCSFDFNIFMSDSPKLLRTTQGTIWVVHLGEPGFFVSCSTGACMMWYQRVAQICDCNNNVSVPWTWWLLRLHQLTEMSLVQLLRRWI